MGIPAKSWCAAAMLAVAPAIASAATVLTFDGLTNSHVPFLPFIEGDYQVTGYPLDGFYFIGGQGSLHLDIALGPYEATYAISRVDGQPFSFLSLDTVAYEALYQFPADPQDDLRISGYLGGTLTATIFGTSQDGGETVYAGSGFQTIDLLLVTAFLTQNVTDAFNSDPFAPDIHFGVDNIVVAAATVPLPASALLLAGSFFGVGLWRFRTRSGA